MADVIYEDDHRYPAPGAYPPPARVVGLPTQKELDGYPRMFTWGELKEIIQTGDLELLMRNKALQARYDEWMTGMKVEYGSTENYLKSTRLPWSAESIPADPAGTLPPPATQLATPPPSLKNHLPPNLAPSTLPHTISLGDISTAATPGTGGGQVAVGGRSGLPSGAATPSSAGFVSLASLKIVDGKLRRVKAKDGQGANKEDGSGSATMSTAASSASANSQDGDLADEEADGEEMEPPVYLQYDPEKGLDSDKYAVLPNDWPYNIPYGVRHYCVWSRVPIAHPELVGYDPTHWSRIESEGLGGFTGITPLRSFHIPSPPSDLPSPPTELDPKSTSAAPPPPPEILFTPEMVNRSKFIGKIKAKDWYAADIAYSGPEARRWAGVEYEAVGGREVGKMVRGLWDPRGWECLWFVNPPRLQSVPGFSHFHVFARRKTPEEIDASEAFWA